MECVEDYIYLLVSKRLQKNNTLQLHSYKPKERENSLNLIQFVNDDYPRLCKPKVADYIIRFFLTHSFRLFHGAVSAQRGSPYPKVAALSDNIPHT